MLFNFMLLFLKSCVLNDTTLLGILFFSKTVDQLPVVLILPLTEQRFLHRMKGISQSSNTVTKYQRKST